VKVSKKLVLATGALLLPLGLVVGIGGVASAARTNQPFGTGLENCTSITGTVTFSPPLGTTGTAPETTTVNATASGCSGGSPSLASVVSTATITGSKNNCSGLATASTPSLAGNWQPAGSVQPSLTSGGAETFQTTPHLGFTITGATTTGSYPGSSFNNVAQTTETSKAFSKACKKGKKPTYKKGVKSLTINSGTVTNL